MLDVLMERVAAGLTVVVATHDLALARAIANQVLLVGDGRVRPLAGEELAAYVSERREPAWPGVGEAGDASTADRAVAGAGDVPAAGAAAASGPGKEGRATC